MADRDDLERLSFASAPECSGSFLSISRRPEVRPLGNAVSPAVIREPSRGSGRCRQALLALLVRADRGHASLEIRQQLHLIRSLVR